MDNSKMKKVCRFHVEIYKCPKTDIEYQSADVESNWKCPDCNDYIYIYAEDDKNKRGVFIRKRADEIVEGDLVKPIGMELNQSYRVLGVTVLKNNKLGVGLKEYAQIKLNPDDCVTCRMGGW